MRLVSLALVASLLTACASGPVRQVIDAPIRDVPVDVSLRDCDASKPKVIPKRAAEHCLPGFSDPRGCYDDVEVGVFTAKLYDWAEHCSGDNATLLLTIDAFNVAQEAERKIVQQAIKDAAKID